MTRTSGFTLVELMVTIAVLAIVLTLAVPGFQALVQNNRATTLANELTTAINLARSEAVRRGEVVTVCADSSDNWEEGWRVELGSGCNATGDDVLRIWDAPHATSVIDASGIESVPFDALGSRYEEPGSSASSEVEFEVHAENCSGERARTLKVSRGGRVSVERTNCP
ncbi:GspH/FimT family pseudopilin [Thioalkalivibrio sp. ALJ24]|uniref:GspH/FimT family pseudopilin n=1 Tax=Thioalkalivibrio sp. ALJ24 TaxID=545276 RepID=UPI0004758982|nr:GspH/FimT family pseudopilin [Thioalkalivibrio sp. ALJ24]